MTMCCALSRKEPSLLCTHMSRCLTLDRFLDNGNVYCYNTSITDFVLNLVVNCMYVCIICERARAFTHVCLCICVFMHACSCVCVCVCVSTPPVLKSANRVVMPQEWNWWNKPSYRNYPLCLHFYSPLSHARTHMHTCDFNIMGFALGRPRRRWEGNIKMDLREVGWEVVYLIRLAQDGTSGGFLWTW